MINAPLSDSEYPAMKPGGDVGQYRGDLLGR